MKFRYTVSANFKEECKENIAVDRQGKIHIVEDNVDIADEDNLVSFTIEDNCYVNDRFIGTTVSKKITVNILNPNNLIDLENKEIQPYVGINNEYVPFGNFIIQGLDNKEVKEKTEFIGYDYMIKFNALYQDRVTYPISASDLFVDVCNQVGLIAGNVNFPNSDYMILGNPFTNNEDCRTVLSNIAQLAGGFARIGRDNKPYIVTLKKTPSNENIDANNYFEDFSKNSQWGEVNSLVLGLSSIEGENTSVEDASSIAQYGRTEVVIEDNFFLINQEEREIAITPIWNSIKGIKYTPFEADYYGYPYLDAGDLITIYDINDNAFLTYIFNHTFTYNGTFSGKIETPALTKTQTAYKNIINTNTKFRQVERKIDKINGEISDIIHDVDENSDKISEHTQTIGEIKDTVRSVEQTTEAIQQEVNSIGATLTEEGQEITIDASENPINLKVYGNTKQTQYEGNQLIDFASPTTLGRATYTFENNILNIVSDGTEESGYNGIHFDILALVKNNPGKTLKFVCKSVDLSNFNSTSNIVVQLTIVNSGTTSYKQIALKQTASSMTYSTYTIPSDTSEITYARFTIYTNNVSTAAASTTIIEEPMLQFGTTAKDYEPYVGGNPAPSPDYPQEIKNVGNNINKFNKDGTNFANQDKDYFTPRMSIYSSVVGSSIWQDNTSSAKNKRCRAYYDLAANKTITISCNKKYPIAFFLIADLDGIMVDRAVSVGNKYTYTSDTHRYICIIFGNDDNIDFTDEMATELANSIKIEEGSQATGYSKYNCGSIDFVINNNNLFITETITTGKYYNTSGNLNTTTNFNVSDYILIEPSTTYVASGITERGTAPANIYFDKNKEYISGARINNTTFTTPANAKYIRLTVHNNDINTLQFEKGSTATTYIKGKQSIITIPLPEGIELCKIGDYADYLYEDNGKWYKHKAIGKIALNGTESWNKANNVAFNSYYVDNLIIATRTNTTNPYLSDYFKSIANNDRYIDKTFFINGTSRIIISYDEITSASDFKTWLSNNNTIVYYVLEIPVEEEIIDEETLKVLNDIYTYKGINHIYCIDEIIPEKISVEYYPNTVYNENLTNKDALKNSTIKLETEIKQTDRTINLRVGKAETAIIDLQESSISNVDVEYALGTSTATAPTTGWSTVAPQWTQGKYMWQRTKTTYADSTVQNPHIVISEPTCINGAKGDQGNPGQSGQDGDDGIGVSAIVEQYYLSTSNTTQTGGSWKETQDTWASGKYIWTRSKITWTNNTTTYTDPILATGINNANIVANNANTKVDNLQIGGRNYALKTGTAKDLIGSNNNNQSMFLYNTSLTINEINSLPSGKFICSFDLTLSGDLTGTSGTPYIAVGQNSTPWNRVIVTETVAGTYHKKISLSSRAWTDNKIGMRCNYIDTGVTVTISNLKVEIGDKYTDWTPAPEDMTSNTQLETVMQEQSSNFELAIDNAKTEVQSSTTGTIMTLLNNGYLTAEQVNALVGGNSEDIVKIKQQLTQTITDEQMQIAIQTAIDGGVGYLKNTLFTLNDEGLWIATNQDEFSAKYDNKGMYLYTFGQMIAQFDIDGSTIKGNLNLEGEMVTPNLRMMNTTVNGVAHTHIHWIGG